MYRNFSFVYLNQTETEQAASKQSKNTLEGFEDSYLKAKAMIWR